MESSVRRAGEVHGSILDRETGYPDRELLWFPQNPYENAGLVS
jgi:hypothetical protein